MKLIEQIIIEKLGQDWLNNGRAKDAGFGVLRQAVSFLPPDAVAFVTACNRFTNTERFDRLSQAEQHKLMNAGHDRHHEAVKEGLLALADSLIAIVQTPERVCHYMQDVGEGGQLIGQPETKFFAESEFGGRMKLFGRAVSVHNSRTSC